MISRVCKAVSWYLSVTLMSEVGMEAFWLAGVDGIFKVVSGCITITRYDHVVVSSCIQVVYNFPIFPIWDVVLVRIFMLSNSQICPHLV